ncbi:749_t:CDS:2, partial [Scutellospora calospora]
MNHIEFQKIHTACISCRESKRKCIVYHSHPICERCLRNNLQCIYPDRKKSGPKKQQMPNQSHFTTNPQLQSETGIFINLQIPSNSVTVEHSMTPYMRILATSTLDNITLQFVQNCYGVYYVTVMHNSVVFKIPDINEFGNGKRPPTKVDNKAAKLIFCFPLPGLPKFRSD